MCSDCEPFLATVRYESSARALAHLDQVRAAIAEGVLELVEASAPLESIEPGRPLPAWARHALACASCGQLFISEIGGCDAAGERWRPLHGN